MRGGVQRCTAAPHLPCGRGFNRPSIGLLAMEAAAVTPSSPLPTVAEARTPSPWQCPSLSLGATRGPGVGRPGRAALRTSRCSLLSGRRTEEAWCACAFHPHLIHNPFVNGSRKRIKCTLSRLPVVGAVGSHGSQPTEDSPPPDAGRRAGSLCARPQTRKAVKVVAVGVGMVHPPLAPPAPDVDTVAVGLAKGQRGGDGRAPLRRAAILWS